MPTSSLDRTLFDPAAERGFNSADWRRGGNAGLARAAAIDIHVKDVEVRTALDFHFHDDGLVAFSVSFGSVHAQPPLFCTTWLDGFIAHGGGCDWTSTSQCRWWERQQFHSHFPHCGPWFFGASWCHDFWGGWCWPRSGFSLSLQFGGFGFGWSDPWWGWSGACFNPFIAVSYVPVYTQWPDWGSQRTGGPTYIVAPPPWPTVDQAWDLLARGDLDMAQMAFEKLLVAGVDEGPVRVGYALTLALLGRDDAAVLALRRVLRDDPQALRLLPSNASRGDLEDRLRQLLDQWSRRSAQDHSDTNALVMVAAIQFMLNDDAVAYFAVSQAVQAGDTDQSTLNLRTMLESAMQKRMYNTDPSAPN